MTRFHFSTTFISKSLIFVGLMIQGIFVTRLLGPEGKGLLSFLQANIAFLVLLLGMTLPTGVSFFAANQKIDMPKILGLAYWMAFFAIVVSGLLMTIQTFWPELEILIPRKDFEPFFVGYFMLSFYLTFLLGVYSALFAGRKYFSVINLTEIVITISKITFYGVFYLKKDKFPISLHLIFAIDLLFTFCQVFTFYMVARYKYKVFTDFSISWKEHLKPLMSYILPLYWTGLITFLYTRIDLWIVEKQRGLVELGIYSIAVGAAQLITFFPIAINTVLYAYLVQAQGFERERIFENLSKFNFVFVLSGALFLFVFGEKLIPILYGQNFAFAGVALKILVWGYMLSSIKFLFIVYNQVNIKLADNIISELIVLFISIVLNVVLVAKIGILGASLSVVISNFIALAFLLYRLKSYSRLNLLNCFSVRRADIKKLIG